jgi:hypothetical protein
MIRKKYQNLTNDISKEFIDSKLDLFQEFIEDDEKEVNTAETFEYEIQARFGLLSSYETYISYLILGFMIGYKTKNDLELLVDKYYLDFKKALTELENSIKFKLGRLVGLKTDFLRHTFLEYEFFPLYILGDTEKFLETIKQCLTYIVKPNRHLIPKYRPLLAIVYIYDENFLNLNDKDIFGEVKYQTENIDLYLKTIKAIKEKKQEKFEEEFDKFIQIHDKLTRTKGDEGLMDQPQESFSYMGMTLVKLADSQGLDVSEVEDKRYIVKEIIEFDD